MVDNITLVTPTNGSFDTAAMQIAAARAQAIAAHTNEAAFLAEIAKNNDETNAHALDGTTAAAEADPFLTNDLFNLDAAGNPTLDPTADPTNLALFSQFGTELPPPSTASVKAQQIHDIAVLQKDAELLESAANEESPVPLNDSASTVDLSAAAQGIVDGNAVDALRGDASLPATSLAQLSAILQPVANAPLNAALLQQIQARLTAARNPIQLNLSTLAIAMSFLAASQPIRDQAIANVITPDNEEMMVDPVADIGRVALENGTVKR